MAIARALAMQPRIMLFDRAHQRPDPGKWWERCAGRHEGVGLQEGMTMVVVTHEMGFAREVADRVLFMEQQAGGRETRRLLLTIHPPRACASS